MAYSDWLLTLCQFPTRSQTIRRLAIRFVRLLGCIGIWLLPQTAYAQTPSFDGREFRRIWTDGEIPEGVSSGVTLTDAFLANSGVYISTNFTPSGVYYIQDEGASTIASREQDAFESTMNWLTLGIQENEYLLFVPVTFNNIYPVQLYGPAGLTAVTEPTPDQGIGQYVENRGVYTTISSSDGVKVWQYTQGEENQLLLDDTTTPGLNGHLDYDGESILFTTGQVDVDAAVWIRLADGTAKRILQHGNSLPGSTGTYRGLPAQQGSFVDQGRVYFTAQSQETFPFFPDQVFLASDGDTTEVLLKRGQEVPGQTGVTLDGFEVGQVRNGRIWFVATLSGIGKSLYLLENGEWTQIVSPQDSLDGRNPVGFRAFRFGARGNDVMFQASFVDFNKNPPLSNELYTNAELPGLTIENVNTNTSTRIVPTQDGQWLLALPAQAGKTYTLEFSQSFQSWEALGDPIAATTDTILEWLVPLENAPRFFRVKVE